MKIPERTEAQDDRDFRRIWRRESERYYEDEATRADDRIKREKVKNQPPDLTAGEFNRSE